MIARPLLSCACVLSIVQASAWCCDPDPSEDSFALAEYMPADVTAYVNVIGGGQLRRELALVPMGDWLTKWSVSPELAGAWSALARSAQMSSGDLFDAAFGEGFTLAVRGSAEWVIISRVDPERGQQLLRPLAPRLVDYWQDMRMYDVPEHQLLVSRVGGALLIGPRGKERALFESVCNAFVEELANPLSNDESFEAAAELGGGSLFVFVRHAASAAPVNDHAKAYDIQFAASGGEQRAEIERRQRRRVQAMNWTAVTGSLEDSVLTIRHASSQPIVPVSQLSDVVAWDMAPLKALGGQNTLALIKSDEQNGGIIELVVDESLGSEELRAAIEGQNVGRRILVVDDAGDGVDGERPVRVIVARAVELDCDDARTQELLLHLRDENARIRNLGSGAYLVSSNAVKPVCFSSLSVHEYTHDEVSAVFRGLPVMAPRPLQWTVAEGPDADWCVMSNDPDKLQAMAEALAADGEEACTPNIGAWVSCGAGDGQRLAELLRNFADSGSNVPPQLKGMTNRDAIAQLTAVAGVVDQFCWSLARTGEDRLSLEVVLKLCEMPTAAGTR